jgi:hypothetical protein
VEISVYCNIIDDEVEVETYIGDYLTQKEIDKIIEEEK